MNIKVVTIHEQNSSSSKKRNPLNPLTTSVRKNIISQLKSINTNDTEIVIITSSPNLSAGMDITEFSAGTNTTPTLHDICNTISALPIITICYVQGLALGGGFEIALCCDYIFGSSKSMLGLPEVKIGVFPGSGGSQRLPRVCGVEKALDIICTGRNVLIKEALACGIVSGIAENENELMNLISNMELKKKRLNNIIPSQEHVLKTCFAYRSKRAPKKELGGEAIHTAIQSIQNCYLPLDEGLKLEAKLFRNILQTNQCQSKVHLFLSERQVTKVIGDTVSSARKPSVSRKIQVGVIGAGTMGSGIALAFLKNGFPNVILTDVNVSILEQAMKRITKSLKKSTKPSNFKTSTSLSALSNCDLIIEAVYENLSLKQKIASQLTLQKSNCILVSNTSTLSVTSIFEKYSSPQNTCGMHFFSPAHVMPLVEIVLGSQTSLETVQTIQVICKLIKKVGVVVYKDINGFVGNRMIGKYSSESEFLLLEGCSVPQVDNALLKFGMKMGVFAMGDLAGNDIGYLIRKEKGLTSDVITDEIRSRRPQRYSELADDLVKDLKRLGQKSQKGWYDYTHPKNPRIPIPSREVAEFITKYRIEGSSKTLTNQEIIERVLFPLVNEGFKILEKQAVKHPSDVDIVYIYGYGFPNWRGGPMFWIDREVGLPYFLQKLLEFYKLYGSEYFEPSQLLKKCVELKVGLYEFYNLGLEKKLTKDSTGLSINSKL